MKIGIFTNEYATFAAWMLSYELQYNNFHINKNTARKLILQYYLLPVWQCFRLLFQNVYIVKFRKIKHLIVIYWDV